MARLSNARLGQPATRPESEILFHLSDPMFLFGFLVFFLNRLADNQFNFPVGDLLFPVLVFYMVAKEGVLHRLLAAPGSTTAFLLMFLILVSNLVHGVGLTDQLRNGYATFTLFLTVCLFALSENRKPLMSYILGSIVGFGVYFIGLSLMALITTGDIPRTLRGEQPTPVVAMALYALLRHQLSRPIRFVLLASVVVSLLIAIVIQARGPLVSIIIAGGIFLLARVSPKPRFSLVVVLAGGLLMHFIFTFFTHSMFDVVANSTNNTVSNMQRAYSIDFSRAMMDLHPLLGMSMDGFRHTFNPDFVVLTGYTIADTVSTPHNAFLEYAVFFGYPVGLLFVFLVVRMAAAGIQVPAMARTFFVACCIAGIIRIGAFFGFSGWLRVEWFALAFALYYAYAAPVSLQSPSKTLKSTARP